MSTRLTMLSKKRSASASARLKRTRQERVDPAIPALGSIDREVNLARDPKYRAWLNESTEQLYTMLNSHFRGF
jgi:hypothetical protein